MILKECLFINNDCYKALNFITDEKPKGIVVHSTGANNKTLKRCVQPVESQSYYKEVLEDIGVNKFGNHWNRSGIQSCVHAFIGVNAQGIVETYQVLPFNICAWGVGRGSKGSYNFNPTAHLQFEICEDDLTDENYFKLAMKEAQEFCAYLCKLYDLPVSSIVSHKECHDLGYGINHGDPDHWLKKFNKDMNWFRDEVRKLLDDTHIVFRVQVGAFVQRANAEKMLEELNRYGFNGFIVTAKKGVD